MASADFFVSNETEKTHEYQNWRWQSHVEGY